jgi:hypothetical protein
MTFALRPESEAGDGGMEAERDPLANSCAAQSLVVLRQPGGQWLTQAVTQLTVSLLSLRTRMEFVGKQRPKRKNCLSWMIQLMGNKGTRRLQVNVIVVKELCLLSKGSMFHTHGPPWQLVPRVSSVV